MRHQSAPRARRISVAAEEPLIDGDRYDYADAFEVRVSERDARSAEQFAQCAMEQGPPAVSWTVRAVQQHLLGLRLAPRSSPGSILGWKILTSAPDLIHLEAVSPLLGRGVIVGRRLDRTRVVVTTYVFYARPALARIAWTIAGPLHRWVARYLLEHAADIAAAGDAVKCAVPDAARALVRLETLDYMDAFAIDAQRSDGLPAEAWARAMFTPRGFFSALGAWAWRSATGVETPRTGKRLGPFQLVSPEHESAVLAGDGPRYRVRLVVLAGGGRLTLATFVQSRGAIWRQLLKAIMIGHRRVAPRLLEGAVAAANRRNRRNRSDEDRTALTG